MENVTKESITPLMASAYLQKNDKNRNVSKVIVDAYTREMKDGRWVLSNDAIAFDTDGNLINGQHRLYAVIKSGCTCDFLVVRGMPSKNFTVMDNGYTRTAAQVFKLENIPSGDVATTCLLRWQTLSHGGTSAYPFRKRMTSELLELYYTNKNVVDEVVRLADRCFRFGSKAMTKAEYGGISLYLILDKLYVMDYVFDFFEMFADRKECTNPSIKILRNMLANDRMSKNRMTPQKRLMLIVKTWNSYTTGTQYKKLSWSLEKEPNLWFV